MPGDVGILTTVLKTFLETLLGAYGRLFPDAWRLLYILTGLEVAFVIIAVILVKDASILAELVWLCLKIGFFVALVIFFPDWCQAMIDSFVWAGLKAGGSTMELIEFTNPSTIAQLGLVAVEPLLTHLGTYGFIDGMRNLGDVIITGISALLVILAFFIIAIQV